MRWINFTWLAACLCLAAASLSAQEPPAYRTDDHPDESLPWFQLVDGQFPPEGSAHYFSGELIHVDHLERQFVLRVDRTDQQNRSHFDLPMEATMLPYGSIYYHGAPAALRDIPLGTHLHGWFYLKHPDDQSKPLEIFHNRRSYEVDFRRCFRLEDDFSYHARRDRVWRIDSVDREQMKLAATLLERDGESWKEVGDAESLTFDLQPCTRFWQGRCVVTSQELAPGQHVQFNITWATLYGPGRLLEVWLDKESRELARGHQRTRHLQHIRQRGLPGWVDAVDNSRRIVTITFFGGVDRELLDEIVEGDEVGVAVAEPNLLTYDPVNDRKRGPILEVSPAPKEPGSSGVRIRVRPNLLLEGYRPGRIVRVYPSSWPVQALPKEEELFGR